MRTFLNWSGGKDSAFCLYKAKQNGISIDALVTSVNAKHHRVSMHGVRRSLLELQAASVQLPLYTIELPEQPGMKEYEEEISSSNQLLKEKGFTHAASGDLFLEDLKKYREALYLKDEMEAVFPIWKTNTTKLLMEFISLGFKAIIVCVNSTMLDKNFCGRLIDDSFINDLPSAVDPCGENGEYHSFVFDGPIFKEAIAFNKGERIFREYPAPHNSNDCFTRPEKQNGFYFCDLLPV